MKLPELKKEHKLALKVLLVLVLIAILIGIFSPASAHNWHDHDGGDINIDIDINPDDGNLGNSDDSVDDSTNNASTDGCMCATGGMSSSDLSRGLSLAMASGAHELDFSTQDWQLSATYALQVNEDEEGAGSFKLGKRWDRFANVLMHVTYTPEQGQDYGDWVIVGGTIRF